MPKTVEEIIENLIEDFKEKLLDDTGAVTGNEVEGHTHHDEFINNCIQHTNSPDACESAWQKFQAQGKPAGKKIDKTTGGHVKKTAGMSGDFEDRFKKLEDTVNSQNELITKYEDFFKADVEKKKVVLKDKFKLPFSEETQKLIDDFTYDDLEKFNPLFNKLLEEHPEIVPTTTSTNDLQEIATNRILKMLGKDKKDLRKTEDTLVAMKTEAEKKMTAKWAPKGVI